MAKFSVFSVQLAVLGRQVFADRLLVFWSFKPFDL